MNKKIIVVLVLLYITLTKNVCAKVMEKTNIDGVMATFDRIEGIGSIKYGTNGPIEDVNKNYRILFVDGYIIDGADIITQNDRILVPVRVVSEVMGAQVGWDDKSRLVTIDKDNIKIEMGIGNKNVKINQSPKVIDVAPTIYHERTYVPIRFISENFGADVGYYDNNNENNLGLITKIPQVTIDDKNNVIQKKYSNQQAIEQTKTIMTESYQVFSANIKPDNETQSTYENSIQNMKVKRIVSRYYILSGLEGIYEIAFDMYTGDMYKIPYVQLQTITLYTINDLSNYSLAG
ncbi:MAG: copper amine oxidase N-terminal domain-containing protein [Clostridiales bacterium]|jgi:hypothetical protein|nr:copper amine oxidase N-terminal domain-containing protein [Clostridiales bacterium]